LCAVAALVVGAGSCEQVNNLTKPSVRPTSLRDVPANRLSFRFEPDVLVPPELENNSATQTENLTAIQADFDQRRPQESLFRTVQSPDKQRVLVIYQKGIGRKEEFRLDMYDATGKFIRNIAPENLALVFPDAVAWSPNSENLAFVASRRLNSPSSQEIVQEAPRPPDLDENQNTATEIAPTPTQTPAMIQAFETEQIYLCNRDGGEFTALTKTEGTIYFDLCGLRIARR
jgi:hypothetical protein